MKAEHSAEYEREPVLLCENCGKSMADHGRMMECWPTDDEAHSWWTPTREQSDGAGQ